MNNSELEDLQNERLTLLHITAASKRIQGVSYFEELPDLNEKIISALINRMFNDDNNNVRLTAGEAQ